MTLGLMASDVEQRIDFDAMRAYKLARIQAQIEEKNLGAIICFEPDNIRYATSTALGEWSRDKTVRWCVVPREGKPFLFELGTAAAVKRSLCPWIDQEHLLPGGGWLKGANQEAANQLATGITASNIRKVLVHAGVSDMPIGVDSVDLYILEGLKREGLTIVNGWDALWDARMIKSSDELKLIETSVSLADGCFEHIVDHIRPGVRESDLVAECYSWLLKNGCDRITGVNCVTGSRSHPHPHDSSDRLIRPGEMVYIDIMSHYLGYGTCYYRSFVTTRATQKQIDLYCKAKERLQASIEVVKPGITTTDIARQWPSAQELGYTSELEASGLCVGHGIGLSIHEKPFISRILLDHPAPIEPGMHFALETYAGDGNDGARIESQIIVTETGHRVITQWPWDTLMVCSPR